MYAKVSVQIGSVRVTLPQAAVTYNPYGASPGAAPARQPGESQAGRAGQGRHGTRPWSLPRPS